VKKLQDTEALLPNSSGSEATFRVSSEEAESPPYQMFSPFFLQKIDSLRIM